MTNGAYGPLAYVYDRLNAEVDYVCWADFIEAIFRRYSGISPKIILDLACGTGRMTYELARRGYDLIGVDGSTDMLTQALDRRAAPNNPLYLCQDIRRFELYGSVGAVVCCLDSLNYLTENGDLAECFACVRNYLEAGGLFLFDVSTPYRFEKVFGDNAYVLEDEKGEVYCGWQNCYNPARSICDFYLTVFEKNDDGSYSRFDEEQCERLYGLEEIKTALCEAGLEFVDVFGDFDFSKPRTDTERWHIAAKKP